MALHDTSKTIYYDDEDCVEVPGADENVIEVVGGISIHVVHVGEVRNTETTEVDGVDVWPDVEGGLSSLGHIAHGRSEARLELIGGQEATDVHG